MSQEQKEKKVSTREKILASAQSLFLQSGYNGTSMSDIAKKAGVNQSLIHHHFDTKEKLWGKVRDFLFDEYLKSFEEERVSSQSLKEFGDRLSKLMSYRFNFLKEHPEITRMLEWQSVNANDDESFASVYAGEQSNARIKAMLEGFIKQVSIVQEQGEISQKVKPTVIMLTAIILTSGWFHGNTRWLLQNCDTESHEALHEEYLQFVAEMLAKAVQP